MANDARLEVRLPAEMLERLERLAARYSAETGLEVKVTAVARKLLAEGLDASEAKARSQRRRR